MVLSGLIMAPSRTEWNAREARNVLLWWDLVLGPPWSEHVEKSRLREILRK